MFKFLLSKKKDEPELKNKAVGLCTINFVLQNDGIVTTELFWPEFHPDSTGLIENLAKQFSSLLYLIMNGSFNSDIMETIKDAKTNNTSNEDQKFIETLEMYLSLLKTINSVSSDAINNNPVILPSAVFKNNYAK